MLRNECTSIKSIMTKHWKVFLTYLFIFFITAFTLVFVYKDNVSIHREQPYVEITVPRPDQGISTNKFEISTGEELQQDIVIPGTLFSGFSLEFNNSNKLTEGQLEVCLMEKESKSLIQNWIIDMEDLTYDGYCTFTLKEVIETEAGDEYTVLVNTEGISGQNLIIKTYLSDNLQNNLFIDSIQSSEYAACYQIVGGVYSELKIIYICIFFLILIGLAIGCFFYIKHISVEWKFVVLALIVGITYIFVIPPWSTQDGEAHFATAYAESSRLLGKEIVTDSGKTIVEDDVDNLIFYNPKPGKSSYINYWKGLTGQQQIVNSDNETLRQPLSMDNLGYVPQVLGISLGRILNFTAEQLFVLGRMFALFWYCIVMFWAIKLIPFGKMGLLVVGILPMTMQQAVSYNYDSVLNGAAFFLIAYFLNLIYDVKVVKPKDIVVLLIFAIIIAQIKFIYLAVCLLVFLIPSIKFGGIKKKLGITIGGMGICSLFILLKEFGRISKTVVQSAASESVVGEQIYTLNYCMTHPLDTAIIIFRTLRENFSFFVESMVGGRLGWHHEIIIPTVIIMGYVVLLYVCTLKRENDVLIFDFWKLRCLSAIIVFSVCGLIMISLLLSEASLGDRTIWGIQGRYFLPILPIILFMSRNHKIEIRENGDQWIFCAIHVLQICTIINIIIMIMGN